MASSYTSRLRLTQPATGDLSGLWGDTVNNEITALVDQAVAGRAVVAMTDADYTLTALNGTSDEARNAALRITGTLTVARNVICPTAAKLYIVENATTGGFAITFKTSAGSGISVANGQSMFLRCDGTNVVSAFSYFAGTAASATTATNLAGGLVGQVPYQASAGSTALLAAGTAGQLLQSNGGAAPSWVSALANGTTATTQTANDNSTKVATTAYVDQATSVLRGYIDGLTLSTAGSSTTFTVAAGQAADDANAVMVSLTSAISKTTGSWVVGSGSGGLDTGSIANLTWYHVWLIRRPDTGVEDVLVSLSATSPTMPANYTQKRRIGSMRTNGSGQWTAFRQVQDWFEWDAAVSDAAVSNPGTAAVTRVLTVPTNVVVQAVFNGGVRNLGSAVAGNVYFSPLTKSNEAANEVAAPFWTAGAYTQSAAAGARSSYTMNFVWTDTSAQIRTRLSASDGNVSLYIATLGWIDPRGKNA